MLLYISVIMGLEMAKQTIPGLKGLPTYRRSVEQLMLISRSRKNTLWQSLKGIFALKLSPCLGTVVETVACLAV